MSVASISNAVHKTSQRVYRTWRLRKKLVHGNGMDIVRFGKLPKAVAQKSCVAVAEFEDYLVWPEILRWQSKSVIFCLSLSPKQFRSLCVHAHWLAACNCQD